MLLNQTLFSYRVLMPIITAVHCRAMEHHLHTGFFGLPMLGSAVKPPLAAPPPAAPVQGPPPEDGPPPPPVNADICFSPFILAN
jgi:hypothetical protein